MDAGQETPREPPQRQQFVRQVLASSRFFIAIAVLGTFLASVTIILFGVATVIHITWDTIRDPEFTVEHAKELEVEFIELIDIFLLGTVLYIVALGLYQLFVDPALPMPGWLTIRDLDELKEKIIAVVIVLLGVTFVGSAVNWDGSESIVEFGIAIALVIGALALVLLVVGRLHHRGE
jgi:uncharacterized membrane protein YqhA